MKATRLLCLFSLIFLFISGCNTNPKIGLLLDNTEIDRWTKDKEYFVERVNALGGTVVVKDAKADPNLQFQQALELIKEGVDVIVIIPADKIVSQGIVKTAKTSHIPVIAYDRIIRDCDLDFYVSADNIQVGELQADYLAKIKPTGNYVLLTGPESDNNSYQLYLGWMNILQPLIDKGDITVVNNTFAEKWSEEEGYKTVNNLLDQGVSIDVILAGADILASGVVNALHDRKLDGSILLAGQDADLNAIRNISFGNQTITIYKPLETMAQSAANVAVRLAKGKDPVRDVTVTVNNGHHLIPSILVEGQVVNKQNIRMTVISEGFVAEQEVFK